MSLPVLLKPRILVALCVMVLGAAAPGQKAESRKADAVIAEVERLMTSETENHQKIIDALDAAMPKMRGFPAKASKIRAYQVEWMAKRDQAATTKANVELIEGLERDVHDPEKLASVRIRIDAAKRAAASLAQAGSKGWTDRVAKVVSVMTLHTLRAPFADAKAKEDTGDLTGALATYDATLVEFHKVFDANGGTADAPTIALYKKLLAESDKLVERVETPEFEAKTPERDFLSSQERHNWGVSAGASLSPDAPLVLEGVDLTGGRKVTGVVSLLPPKADPWNDFVIDLEFTIQAGSCEMYLRYWPDKRSYRILFSPAEGYEVGKTYRMTLKVKGSTISLTQPEQPENRDKMDATTSRTGGIGFGLPAGSRVLISKLNMKVLR
jgi:hypothetical protein